VLNSSCRDSSRHRSLALSALNRADSMAIATDVKLSPKVTLLLRTISPLPLPAGIGTAVQLDISCGRRQPAGSDSVYRSHDRTRDLIVGINHDICSALRCYDTICIVRHAAGDASHCPHAFDIGPAAASNSVNRVPVSRLAPRYCATAHRHPG
jgi:hypothetical protein